MTHTIKKIITGIILALLGHIIYFFAPIYVATGILISIPCLIFIFEWPKLLNAFGDRHSRIDPLVFTALYLLLPFFLMILVNQGQPRWLLLLFFYMVFMNDTGGYVIGSLFGNHKLSKYSPNKSWEGVFGGLLFSGITAYVLFWWNNRPITWGNLVIITSAITVGAVVGDLFESYLKRTAQVKDSGTWLPGHGGLLDRFDSCIFAIFAFHLLLYCNIL